MTQTEQTKPGDLDEQDKSGDQGESDKQDKQGDQTENAPESNTEAASDFEKQAQEKAPSLVGEFIDFLKYNKKWWLIPIIFVMLLVGLLLLFSASSPVAPFIYPLF